MHKMQQISLIFNVCFEETPESFERCIKYPNDKIKWWI